MARRDWGGIWIVGATMTITAHQTDVLRNRALRGDTAVISVDGIRLDRRAALW